MSTELIQRAKSIITEYTNNSYIFDCNCTDQIGRVLTEFGTGNKICLVMSGNEKDWAQKLYDKIKLSFATNGLVIHGGIIRGAGANAPVEDLLRIASLLEEWQPNITVIVGGGSAIDAGKTAVLYWKLKDKFPKIESFENPGSISAAFAKIARSIPPMIAFNTSISSSHINCFANIFFTPQQRILYLNDPALRPLKSFFDPRWTMTLPAKRVKDAALDAFSHCLETYLTYSGDYEEYIEYICLTGLELILNYLDQSADENNIDARAAIAAASDIGGIAIMTAKPNCGHLISAICGVESHATLCALMNPYFMIMFSNHTATKIAKIANLFSNYGFSVAGSEDDPRGLAESLAEAIFQFYKNEKFPSNLSEMENFNEAKLENLINCATKELSKSGFKQIPAQLNLINVNKYLRLLFEAAYTGDYSIIICP